MIKSLGNLILIGAKPIFNVGEVSGAARFRTSADRFPNTLESIHQHAARSSHLFELLFHQVTHRQRQVCHISDYAPLKDELRHAIMLDEFVRKPCS